MENPEPPPIFAVTEAPPVQQVPVVPPPAFPQPRRSAGGWIVFICFFLLYGVLVFMSIHMKPKTAEHRYLEEEAEIRSTMYLRSGAQALGPKFGQTFQDKGAVDTKTITKLRRLAPADPEAARLLVVADFESKGMVPPTDLKGIKDSRVSLDKDLYSLYSSPKLTMDQANQFSSRLPDTQFAYKLANVHAHDKAGDEAPRLRMAPAWHGMLAIGLLSLAGVMFIGGIVLWIVYFSNRQAGMFQPLGHPVEPLTLVEADRLALRAAVMLVGFIGVEFVVAIGVAAMHASELVAMVLGSVLVLMMVVIVHKLPVWDVDLSFSRLGVTTRHLKRDILWGVGGYVAAIPILAVCIFIGQLLMKVFGESSHPATEIIQSGVNWPTALGLLLSASIIAPFWEEIMFRGTLMPAIARVLGRPLWGILISSFMFASIHPQGIPLWLALGSIGAMNGLIAYQTKSLVPSMILHFLNNTFVLALALSLAG